MQYKCKSPILLLIYNRPDLTAKVISRLRDVAPSEIYVAADGARPDDPISIERCSKTRDTLNNIDWDCNIHRLFRDENLGCGRAVSSAISWFFDNEPEGIILEDDIFPHTLFFKYCDLLLEKFRRDDSIMQISGFNPVDNLESKNSYFKSKYGPIWGWASWASSWKSYDYKMNLWGTINKRKFLRKNFNSVSERIFKKEMYNNVYLKKVDTWDYQWSFAKLLNKGYSIIPSSNLIENLGFGSDSTHTETLDRKYVVDLKKISYESIKNQKLLYKNLDFNKQFLKEFVYLNRPVFIKIIMGLLRKIIGRK